MVSADVGPIGTPTRAERPLSPSTSPTFSRSASVTLEPYDSPLKPTHADSTYASGGQETDLAEEDEDGDLGVRLSRRDKGKGRAVDEEGQPGSMQRREGEVQIQVQEEADEVDDAAEERRVQEVRLRASLGGYRPKADALRRRTSHDGPGQTRNDERRCDARRRNSSTLLSLLLRLFPRPPP